MSKRIRLALTSDASCVLWTGTDEQGDAWTQFRTDLQTDRTPGQCAFCQAVIKSGWQRIRDGARVCDKHVAIRRRSP